MEAETNNNETPEKEVQKKSVKNRIVHTQPPNTLEPITTSEVKTTAAGIPAILTSMKIALKEMGAVKGTLTLLKVNQKSGFDCPGCAWPEPQDNRSAAEFCENGVKAVSEEATNMRILPDFFQKHSVEELSSQTDHWLGKQGRLTHPMILRSESSYYEPISWEDTFELIAKEMNSLESPDEAVFYTSGRTSNEAAFLYQLFVRQFGTNNLPDCSNMCHESSGTGMGETLGVGKGTVLLSDFEKADAIFVIGQNPGTNHPRMLTALQQAVRNGCKIVSINPLPETGLMRFQHPQEPISCLFSSGTPLSTLFLPVRINGDVALLKGIMKEILEQEENAPGTALDMEFIKKYTYNFDNFVEEIQSSSWDVIIEQSGIEREMIRQAADICIGAKSCIYCWAMGLTQHQNGVANIQEVVNLALLRGHLGKPGAGLCPVRGHSNVQGDRTMGIYEKMNDRFLDSLGLEFGFDPPRKHGLDTVDTIRAMSSGRIKLFIGLGGNFLSATPDTELTAMGLRKCRLTVQISTKLNRSHLVTGDQALILPCLGRTEKDIQKGLEQVVTVEDSMSMVHASRGTLEPASRNLRSESAIVCGIAKASLGERSRTDWDGMSSDYSLIRNSISHVVPGFQNFNERLAEKGAFHLPNPAADLQFHTPSGKAEFTIHPIPIHSLAPGRMLLTTIRSHDQYNTTIYGLDDRYRGIHNGRRVLFINVQDLEEQGLHEGQYVNIVSHFGNEERIAKQFRLVPYPIPFKCCAAYFPEANVLVPIDSVAEKSNTPASKSVEISIHPCHI